MTLGKKLFQFRAEKGLKQEQVAYDLEVSQSTYSDWENDLLKPRKENLLKLANYFNVDIKELVEEIFNINIQNDVNAIALVNSPNSKINSTDAIIKIADSIEKLVFLIEKLTDKNNIIK